MGATDSGFPAAILPSLRDGTFPTSDELLTSEVSHENVPAVLDALSNAKKELSDDIRKICREQERDVDEWIVQARKVQADIARCKIVAQEIVKEHEKVRTLEAAEQDAQAKVSLLQDEISFLSRIKEEFENVGKVNQDLDTVQAGLAKGALNEAATQLQTLKKTISSGRASRSKDLLNARREYLANEAHARLEGALDSTVRFGRGSGSSWVEINPEGEGSSHGLDNILEAFQHLGTLHKVTTTLTARLEDFIIQPLLASTSEACASVAVLSGRLALSLSTTPPPVQVVLQSSEQTIQFLHSHLPELVRVPVAAHLLPVLVSKLIKDWLMPSVPLDLANIERLRSLQEQTRKLADLLVSFQWPCYQELFDWVELAPSMWLARRKMASLHGVRKTLSSPRGPVRQVERVETETVSKEEAADAINSGCRTADLKPADPTSQAEDEEASGWDFDDVEDETEHEAQNGEQQTVEDDIEAAWGWDDEENPETPANQTKPSEKVATNGLHNNSPAEREVTLVETYTITDIPDYLLEIIGRDILDAQTVKDPEYSALESASPSEGLLALPNFVLAMFRATAPTYYTTSLNSGNMHLYNDSMYIVQKLRESSIRTEAIDSGCRAVEKFGRSAYAREMDTQRIILGDLLDGAQGFVRCTQAPNSNECEIAVTSCVDRIRAIHSEWSAVLSHSALLQSIGSLMSSVIGKIIENIIDMDNISEPESKRLSSFCNQLSTLEDMFIPQEASTSGIPSAQEGAIALTALYVPNWLKFQFLINMLEASLVDIKWLWTEGQMSLEFEEEEVVDLIKALFEESSHRRSAITAIRQHQTG
jgi:protein transport protein DSL1/ZW10